MSSIKRTDCPNEENNIPCLHLSSGLPGPAGRPRIEENNRPLADTTINFVHNEPEKIKKNEDLESASFTQKKTMAQGMMDLALVTANCNQLRSVLDMRLIHPYYLMSFYLIIFSLSLQVIVGMSLLYTNRSVEDFIDSFLHH
jgi:Ninjurin